MRPTMLPAFNLRTSETVRLELRLADSEGHPWVLTISPGMERFIGAYPRLPELSAAGPLLRFVPTR